MEIRPADLGNSRAVDLFRMRGASQFTTRRGGRLRAALSGRGTPLDRFWGKATGLSEPAATTAIKSANGQLMGIAGGFGAGWGRTPLNEAEVEELLYTEDDDLERSFLLLVREALRQQHLPEAAETELREAIRVLGTALDRLPPAPSQTAQRDAESLRTEARNLRQQALQEADRVAADSLERRADALERSASAVEKSSTLLRRNSLLRQELQAQLEALRLELTSTSVVGADTSGLAQVASVARGVAREADALATARTELDSPQVQSVGGTR